MRTKPTRRATIVAAVVLSMLALVPAALAGKGNDPPLVFSSTSLSVGQQYTVSLSGLSPSAWTTVGAYFPYPSMTRWCSAPADSAGNWSCTFTALEPGSILHQAYELQKNGSMRLVGAQTITVSP